MLVITRKPLEEIIVDLPDGRLIVICFVEVKGGTKGRIGIAAPDDIPVNRREVYEAIKREESSAVALLSEPVIRDPLGVAEAYEEAASEGATANG